MIEIYFVSDNFLTLANKVVRFYESSLLKPKENSKTTQI